MHPVSRTGETTNCPERGARMEQREARVRRDGWVAPRMPSRALLTVIGLALATLRAGSLDARAQAPTNNTLTAVPGIKVGQFTRSATADRLHGRARRGGRQLVASTSGARRYATRDFDRTALLRPGNLVQIVHAISASPAAAPLASTARRG